MKILAVVLALIVGLSSAATVSAKDNGGAIALQAVPATLHTDSAYLLMRTSIAKSGLFPIQPVLLRIPSQQEQDDYRVAKKLAYDAAIPELAKKAKGSTVPPLTEFTFDYPGRPNTFVVESKKFLIDGEMRTMLIEVPPGTYLLYGITIGGGGLVTCNCLGTVSFSAPAGIITNVGSLYADKVHKKSPIPYLEDNLGAQMFQYGFIFGEALVPPDGATPIPEILRALPVEPAQFEIVGQYFGVGAANINRLAPIPGLLGYEHGKPVDLRARAVR